MEKQVVTHKSQQKFRSFIVKLMKRGKMTDNSINTFLTKDVLNEFKIAFTHPSAGEEKDYQLYEFLGDVVINEFVPFHLRKLFPKIVNVKWITRLKHTLISKKYLAKIAREEGIDEFAIYGSLPFSDSEGRSFVGMIKEIELNSDLNTNMHYLNMLEDIMESFFGCLVTVLTTGPNAKLHGVATEISHNILRSLFSSIEIPHTYEEVFDPVTRLKEMYESKNLGYKWPVKDAFKYERFEKDDGNGGITVTHKTTVYGWPQGKKTPEPINRLSLATAIGVTKDFSKQEAAQKALRVLADTWGVKDIPLNPHEK